MYTLNVVSSVLILLTSFNCSPLLPVYNILLNKQDLQLIMNSVHIIRKL